MKTGMNLLLWTTHVTSEHFPILEKIKKAGFDGVELPLFAGDAAHYETIGKELKNQGLGCTTVTVVNPDESPISPDESVRRKALDKHFWAIEATAALGGEVLCGPFHSPLGLFSGTGPTEDEMKRAVDVLVRSATFAKKNKVMLAIESLNRFECYFLTTAAQAKELVHRVNHPNFRTMFDTFHANIEEKNSKRAIHELKGSFVHVHISESDRGTPGTGQVHWGETFDALQEVKYDGWLVIEAFGRAMPDLAAATKIWRDVSPNPEEVYTQGLRLIREKWEQSQAFYEATS